MNEIDPANTSNGSVNSSEIQHQEEGGLPQSTNRSPLLSSLLTSVHKHDNNLSNGQERSRNAHGLMMPSSASTIVANPQYDESVAYLKKASQNTDSSSSSSSSNIAGAKEDLSISVNSHRNRIQSNLNDLLQRNNNNNKVVTASETSAKSILENCLLKPPSAVKNRLESQHQQQQQQYYNNSSSKMNESDYHHHHGSSGSSSTVLKFAHQSEENRKVEPLKINLNREPIRTVIKIPHSYENSPTKITIKAPHPPSLNDRNNSVITTSPTASISISPTLSSSSSHSSESSYEHYNDSHQQQRPSSIQVVPKLHLRTPFNNEQSELHIVPKLTITGLNSPQTSSTLHNQQNEQPTTTVGVRDHSVNSILDGPAIPKLTIKKDNNTNEVFYHLNHEGNAIPKLHIKTNHHHHHHHTSQQKDGVKLTIKSLPEQPTVPKLTIKTTDNDTKTIVNPLLSSTLFENEQAATTTIPKLTIKANQSQPTTPKLTIKPVIRPPEDQSPPQEESIPKLTLKAVNNSTCFEKIVPKLVVKLPKETQPDNDEYDEKESSSGSSTPSPPLPAPVPKLSIKQIPNKEVPKQPVKNCTDTSPVQSEVKFSINRLIGATAPEQTSLVEKSENELVFKPLEINTSIIKSADSGQDSPRIILKINKTNNESTTTEIIPQLTENVQKSVVNVNHKRTHPIDNADEQEETKKPKLNDDDDDVIIINDSDTSNDASNQIKSVQQQKQSFVQEAKVSEAVLVPKPDDKEISTKSNSTPSVVSSARSLRQTRRNHEAAIKQQQQQPQKRQNNNKSPQIIQEQENSQLIKEESQGSESIDPLALSNDGTANSNSVDELITPRRGRGRPKKLVPEKVPIISEESVSRDPLEIEEPPESNDNSFQDTSSQQDETNDSQKKTPAVRGRGRGRGRLKRTVEVMKNGKPVQITLEGHDDDDSPSFSLYNRSLRGGFTGNKRSKGGKAIRGGKGSKSSPFLTPERSKDGNFMTPSNSDFKENNRKRLFTTPAIFEEDTRMSIGGNDSQTPMRIMDMHSNEESQSSILSSTSNTIDGSVKKRAKKMEVCDSEGRTEFTVDMLAEYDWPQNESGKNRDTYMIQEQIAEYLGIKSFKRKYPDLLRRPVDMEERNHLFENGLASEKMCDLGLTAVYASEVLDIMCNDYPEKYEEYKRYQREKIFKNARLRLETAVVDRSQMQKDKAITSASEWNTRFNKDRRENRRCCMDLQNFLIQKPTPIRDYKTTPSAIYQSPYPVALVPGQFSEYYEKYTPEQLACYPINTVLVDFNKLQEYLKTHPDPYDVSSDSSDSSDDENDESDDSGSSTDSDSSNESSEDDYEDPICKVCSKTPFTNRFNQPEKFIKCSTCKNEAHPSCIEMSQRMYVRSLAYSWQCSNCKACSKCKKSKDNKMLYCIQCDRGFHIYCLGLRNVPEGHYHCVNCTICSECGAKSPEGHFNANLTQQQRQDLAMIAQWNHEFTINPLTNIQEHKASLCLPCFRKNNQKKTDE